MDDNGSFNYLIYGKTIGQKQGERTSVVSEQRRQVPGMVWVPTIARIIMGHNIRKWIVHIAAAIGALVDMESEDTFFTRGI